MKHFSLRARLTAAFLLIYLIVVLPLSIVAASKVKALLSHRLERPKAYF